MSTAQLPFTRFKGHATTPEIIQWLKTHRYVYYQAPMDISPTRLYLTSKVQTWKRSPNRFAVSVEHAAGFDTLRFRINESHADRIRIPHVQWWHGITATVQHEYALSTGVVSHRTPGDIKARGSWDGSQLTYPTVTEKRISIHQSNGYWLGFNSLSGAISFCRHKNIRLTVSYGKRTRVLVAEHADIGG